MNAAEHIVESYFRLCRDCFTISDRKVTRGNNRQLDILAYDLRRKLQFHIEVSVTHRQNWCSTFEELEVEFEKKFFGTPPKREGAVGGATDFEKGKSYFPQIEETYTQCGFSPADVKRVWVCWMVKAKDNSKPIVERFCFGHPKGPFEIEILSLRDFVLPALEKAIGTANYDDEILRIIGFMKERESQLKDGRQYATLKPASLILSVENHIDSDDILANGIQAGMDTYTLKSKARPSTLRGGQETLLYDVMEELGRDPVTVEQIVKQCEYRRFKTKTASVRDSVAWHLRNWLKEEIVERQPASTK